MQSTLILSVSSGYIYLLFLVHLTAVGCTYPLRTHPLPSCYRSRHSGVARSFVKAQRHFATSPRHFLSQFRPYGTKFITVTLSRDTVTNSEPIQSHAMRYWNSPIKGISRQSCCPSPHSFCFIVALTIKLHASCVLQKRRKSNPTQPQNTSHTI